MCRHKSDRNKRLHVRRKLFTSAATKQQWVQKKGWALKRSNWLQQKRLVSRGIVIDKARIDEQKDNYHFKIKLNLRKQGQKRAHDSLVVVSLLFRFFFFNYGWPTRYHRKQPVWMLHLTIYNFGSLWHT